MSENCPRLQKDGKTCEIGYPPYENFKKVGNCRLVYLKDEKLKIFEDCGFYKASLGSYGK